MIDVGQDARVRAAHEELSVHDWRFREVALTTPELLERRSFPSLDQAESILFYPLQSWPTFVDRSKIAELARIAAEVVRLVRSVPRRVFDDDPEAMDAFYGIGNPTLTQLLFDPPNGAPGALSRGDFILGEEVGFQCIELNVVANLGGWETGVLARKHLENAHVQEALATLGVSVSHVDTIDVLFDHVLEEAAALVPSPEGRVDIAVILPAERADVERDALERHFAEAYRRFLRSRGRSERGSVCVCGYSDLHQDGAVLRRQGERVHAVIEMYLGETSREAYRCFKAGSVNLYNGPLARFLSDKRNLALLSDDTLPNTFTERERALIERHIPWTRILGRSSTTRDGTEVYLPEHALSHRRELVLKRGQSGGGKEVYLGRFTPADTWSALIDRGIAEGGWVLQRTVDSQPYLYQSGERGCEPHDVVWGPFVFGERYAGAILRMQPAAARDAVNLSRSATEGIVFEVAEGAEGEST